MTKFAASLLLATLTNAQYGESQVDLSAYGSSSPYS